MTQAGNLFDVLHNAAARYGEREFLIMGRRDAVIGFVGLERRAEEFGAMLARLGVGPGDRVALWMTNSIEWAVAAYGIARCGAVMVGVSTRLSPREVAHMLTLTRARAWVMEEIFLDKIQATEHIAPVLDLIKQAGMKAPAIVLRAPSGKRIAGTHDWDEELAKPSPKLPPAADLVAQSKLNEFPEIAGVAAILSTSGTTGNPKGVMLSHASLIGLATEVGKRQELDPSSRFYSIAPFFHCSGYMHALLTNLIAGSTFFGTHRYDADEAWDVITKEKIKTYHGFIGVIQGLADRPGARERLSQFQAAWYSAAAAEMSRLEDSLGVRQCELYGLTETGGNSTLSTPHDPVLMRHDSDGRPLDGVEVKIVDPATDAELPDGEPGEILIRGFNVMTGYFRDPEATAKALRGGWLHTGDRGVKLPGGFVKFLSRLKDVIRVGGENLSPMEVEEVMLGHPAVAEVAVVAGPHPRLTEVPVAFIVPRSGIAADEADIRTFCGKQLANFKVPVRVICLEALPRTVATNRIQKAKLREMLAEKA